MSNKKNNITGAIILVVIILIVFTSLKPLIKEGIETILNGDEKYFRIISSNANSFFEEDLIEFAKKEKRGINPLFYLLSYNTYDTINA